MSRRKSSGHRRAQRSSGEADMGQPWAKAVPTCRSVCLQHSCEHPRLEEQGLLELNHVRLQLELGIVNDGTEAKFHLTDALLQDSVSWFWVGLNHLQTGEGRITDQSPESQAEQGIFWPLKSATYKG